MKPFEELLNLILQQPTNRKDEHEIVLPYGFYNDVQLSIKLRHDPNRTEHLVNSKIEIVTGGIGYGLHPDFANFWLVIAKKVLGVT